MVTTCYNYHNPKDSPGISSYLHQLTYLGGPTQGRDTMTAQFPRVTIMFPMVFSGWGHIPILDTPKFHSVSFHIPTIWLVYTPLCWWLLMLNHQGQKPKPIYPIVSLYRIPYEYFHYSIHPCPAISLSTSHLLKGIPTGLECIWWGFGRSFGSMMGKFTGPPYNSW